jgi:hypothetical protein
VEVRAALDDVPNAALRRMAAAHGLPVDDATTRQELVDRLAERLSDAVYVAELVASLAGDERQALLTARASGGETRGLLIDRDQPGAAAGLVERGLLFRTFAAAGPRRGEVLTIPDEILAALPAPPAPAPPPATDAPPAERRSTDPAFSLFALASSSLRPGASLETDVQAWSAEPGDFEWSARWRFLHHLGQSSGLLEPGPLRIGAAHGDPTGRAADALGGAPEAHQPNLVPAPGPSAALARALDQPAALAERLRRAYLRDRSWSELAAIGLDDAESLADPTLVRAAVLAAIDQLPEDAWITVQSFSDWLHTGTPDFLREQLDPRGMLRVESTSWADLELPLLRHVLLGPAYWLGMIATSADGQLIARRGPPRRVDPEPCTWSDAGELLAPARVRLGTLLLAERYLVLEERGRTSRYRLLQQHVAATLGSGGSIDECRRLLVRLSQGALPAPVAGRLESWYERFGATSIRPAVLVEARSEADLDAALAEERVQPFIQRRLGPLAAEVAAADALALASALRAAGQLPRVDAALRLTSEPRRAAAGVAYAGLVDEQVLEFLLVSLLAFQQARPERLAELEGAHSLLERLERQFAAERLRALRAAAERLAGDLRASATTGRAARKARAPRTARNRRVTLSPVL